MNVVNNNFQNESMNYLTIKQAIIEKINSYYSESQKRAIFSNNPNTNYDYYIFYIYDDDETDYRIISIGIVGKNSITNNGTTKIHGKEYFYINYLLSRDHILKRLPDKYAGICVFSTEKAIGFYRSIGFTGTNYLFTLDKTPENISRLESKLPHPITTEFYSTYPDNRIT